MQIELAPVTDEVRFSNANNVNSPEGRPNGIIAFLAFGVTVALVVAFYAGRVNQAKRTTKSINAASTKRTKV